MSQHPHLFGSKELNTSRDAAPAINPRKTISKPPCAVAVNDGADDLYSFLRDCRARVWEGIVYGGPEAALEAIVLASINLAPLVAEDGIYPATAFDPLQACAENIGLVELYGQDAVQEALATGPRLYAAQRLARAAA